MKSFRLGRYMGLVVSIAIFLALYAAILSINYLSAQQIAADAHAIHLASRQSTLSQEMLTGLYRVEGDLRNGRPTENSITTLGKSFSQFDEALDSFIYGGELIGLGQGQDRLLLSNSYAERNTELLQQIETMWQPYRRLVSPVVYSIYSDFVFPAELLEDTKKAIHYGQANNEELLELTNQFALSVEGSAFEKTLRLREIQTWGLVVAVIYFFVLVLVVVRRLTRSDLIAQKSSEAKINFLANMSHEIRTPMNGVMGILDLIGDTELDRTQKSLVSTAKTSAEGLLHVLNDILDISKIEAGKVSIEQTNFDLTTLFEETVSLFSPAASEKNIEIICAIPDQSVAPLIGDPNRIRQVLSNILGNAVKFTQAGEINALLEVKVQDDRASIRMAIRDTGIGMTAETIKNLFDPFTQADESTTRKFGGTGLGMSISKQLIDLMGGQISVQSEPGEGSAFEITLDLPKSDQPFGLATSSNQLTPAKVLIVDDNRSNLKILESYLRHWGLEPKCAESAREVLQIINSVSENSFDLCITDYRMPEMDGLELIRRIREDALAESTDIILLGSGGFSAALRDELRIASILPKPVHRSELFKRVSHCLGHEEDKNKDLPKEIVKFEGRVLLVEDNKVNQLVAKSMLAKVGLEVGVAENGYKALTELFDRDYDLVLMDCQMPLMDGYEATRQRREHEREMGLPPIPIVALTANAMKGDREKCIEAGMNDYLTKPIRPAELKQKLADWLLSRDRMAS